MDVEPYVPGNDWLVRNAIPDGPRSFASSPFESSVSFESSDWGLLPGETSSALGARADSLALAASASLAAALRSASMIRPTRLVAAHEASYAARDAAARALSNAERSEMAACDDAATAAAASTRQLVQETREWAAAYRRNEAEAAALAAAHSEAAARRQAALEASIKAAAQRKAEEEEAAAARAAAAAAAVAAPSHSLAAAPASPVSARGGADPAAITADVGQLPLPAHGSVPAPPPPFEPLQQQERPVPLSSIGGADFLRTARRLVADFIEGQTAVAERLGLRAGAVASAGGGPSGLASAVPADPVAREVWKAVRQAVSRVTGTLDALGSASAALRGVLADAASADAARPLAALPPRLGGGLYYVYAIDVLLAAVARRTEGELPGGTLDDVLTPTFAFARLLRGAADGHPTLVRRYYGALFLACPFVAPTAEDIAPAGATVAVHADTVSQLAALHAAVLASGGRGADDDASALCVQQAWRLVARIANRPPHAMAGRILHAVLLYAGHALSASCGVAQVAALMRTLEAGYMPILARCAGVEQTHVEILRQLLVRAPARTGSSPQLPPALARPPRGVDIPQHDARTDA